MNHIPGTLLPSPLAKYGKYNGQQNNKVRISDFGQVIDLGEKKEVIRHVK